MYHIKNILYLICFISCVLFFAIFGSFLFFSKKLTNGCLKFAVNGTLFFAKIIYKIDWKIEGFENIIKNQPCVIVSEHQSTWETLIFFSLLDKSSYVASTWITNIPIFGMNLKRAGTIQVDRNGGTKEMKNMLDKMKDKLKHNYNIIIFPQGTRVPYGEKKSKYKFSFIQLYNDGFTIVPVALNSGKYWPKGWFSRKTSGIIIMKVMDKIEQGFNSNEARNIFIEKIQQSNL